MHSRIASDHITAGVLGTLTYGVCTVFHAARPAALVAGIALYAALIVAFVAYRRSLRELQPSTPLVRTTDETAGARTPSRRRRHLRAA